MCLGAFFPWSSRSLFFSDRMDTLPPKLVTEENLEVKQAIQDELFLIWCHGKKKKYIYIIIYIYVFDLGVVEITEGWKDNIIFGFDTGKIDFKTLMFWCPNVKKTLRKKE